MRYNFLVTIRVATSPLGFEYDEDKVLCTPTKIAEVKTFTVLTNEGYNKAYFSAMLIVDDYIKNHYTNEEVCYTLGIMDYHPATATM